MVAAGGLLAGPVVAGLADPLAHAHSEVRPSDERADGLDLRRSASDPTDGVPVPVGAGPADVAVGHGALWVVNGRDGTVSRHDPDSGEPIGPAVEVGEGATAVAIGRDAAWVAAASDGTVSRLDPRTGEVTGSVEVGALARAVAVGQDGTVYATSAGDGVVVRIDPDTLETSSASTQPGVMAAFNGPGPSALAVDGDVLWVVNTLKRQMVRMDAGSLEILGEPVPTGAGATDVLVAYGQVWVANTSDGTVTRYDRDDAEPIGAPIEVDRLPEFGGGPAALAAAFGDVWVLNNDERTVVRLDPTTGALTDEVRFLANYHADVPRGGGLVASGRAVWATDEEGDRIVRLDP